MGLESIKINWESGEYMYVNNSRCLWIRERRTGKSVFIENERTMIMSSIPQYDVDMSEEVSRRE